MSLARQQAMSDIQTQILMTDIADENTQPVQSTGFNEEEQTASPIEELTQLRKSKIQQQLYANSIRLQQQQEDRLLYKLNTERQKRQQQALNAFNLVRNFGSEKFNTLAALPQPTGIAVPLGILLFLFFALIPVNGHTRLYWLWLSIVGHAKLNVAGQTTAKNFEGIPASDTPTTVLNGTDNGPTDTIGQPGTGAYPLPGGGNIANPPTGGTNNPFPGITLDYSRVQLGLGY